MTTIGTLDIALDDGIDSGVALLLVKAPETDIRVSYGNCQLLASPSTPHVVCRFAGATSAGEAYDKGSLLAQEALDVLSMVGRADLVTRDAEDEHLVWWETGSRRVLSLVSTATFSLKGGPVSLTVKDYQGNVVPPTPVIPKHHIGFRFYRLSQTSDDLYDAFRNMYLAFESLLSSRYPKAKGQEIDWLRQSLASASSDLALPSLAPAGTPDCVAYVLDVIYNGARLPLFHAKDGKAYFAPVHSASDRKGVVNALGMLTHIVLRMADAWYSARRMSSWFNLALLEQQNRKLFAGTRYIFTDNPAFTLKDDLKSDSIANGVCFPAVFNEQFGTVTRHNIAGQLPVSSLISRGKLHAIYLVNDESPLISFSPDTTIDLSGFDDLEVCLFIRGCNAGAPKYMYAR